MQYFRSWEFLPHWRETGDKNSVPTKIGILIFCHNKKHYIDRVLLMLYTVQRDITNEQRHMTKLYQKLIKKAPSENEVRKGLKAVSLMNEGTPDKRMLMGILNSIDLTSLNPTDNKSNILQLTGKVNSFSGRFSNIPNVAAICVYPNFVSFVKEKLTAKSVRIASVAGGFPSSQTFRMLKVSECKMAVEAGADEIDIVMPVGAFFEKILNRSRKK